jgi:sterol desaturase/sphingolipid hydroxylase (fatty acid hydroxylase superfamily)
MILFSVYMVSYWIPAAVFFLADVGLVYVGERMEPLDNPARHYAKAAPVVFRNQVCVHWPALTLIPLTLAPASPWTTNVLHLGLALAINALGFSVAHHAMHLLPWAYRLLHKQHHEFSTHIVSITSEYNSLGEECITWLLLTWLPLYFFPLSRAFACFYVALNAAYGVMGHSCYKLPFMENDIHRHLLHHKLFTCNYSGVEAYDALLGTNVECIQLEGKALQTTKRSV